MQSRVEKILQNKLGADVQPEPPQSRVEELLLQLEVGGSGGITEAQVQELIAAAEADDLTEEQVQALIQAAEADDFTPYNEVGAVVIGENATSKYKTGMAIGTNAAAVAPQATAIGAQANVSSRLAVAIGYQAEASANGAVAIGFNTKNAESATVAIGNRRLTQLANGTNDADAVTMAQLNALIARVETLEG